MTTANDILKQIKDKDVKFLGLGFTDPKGEGAFHIGFEVPDADAAEDEARAQGLPVLMRGRRANRTGFTYYDSADLAGVTLLTRATNRPGQ